MIFGCVGLGAMGKTLTSAAKLWDLKKRKDAYIVSNTPLVDLRIRRSITSLRFEDEPVNPASFGQSWADEYIYKLAELVDYDNAEIFIDEIAAWLASKDYASVPDHVVRLLSQDRKEGINLHYTARLFGHVWKDIREQTIELTECVRYGDIIKRTHYDPNEGTKPKKSLTFGMIEPSVYNLYQTMARIGDGKTGEGYGLGKRKKGGAARGQLIEVLNWTEHKLAIKVTRRQFFVLARMYGIDALDSAAGRYEWDDEKTGVRRITYHMPSLPVPKNFARLEHGPVQMSLYRRNDR